MTTVLAIILMFCAFSLIVLVLIQRGKGGGLTGALGGMGGQSAFGTKAGDLFTRITIVVATVWILFCGVTVRLMSQQRVDDPTKNANFGVSEPAPPGTTDSGSPTGPNGSATSSTSGDSRTSGESAEGGSAKPAGEASSGSAQPGSSTPAKEANEQR